MKRMILIFFAAIGVGVSLLLVLAFTLSLFFLSGDALPDRVVLEVDLSTGLVETSPDDPLLLALEPSTLRTRDLVVALERAAGDTRVRALLVRGDAGLPGWGTAEEIRDAVALFRASGKPAVFFTESFGELTPGQLSYYLATAFDEIHIQPSGEVGLAPLLMESLFFRGLLDRWEILPRFDRRAEYKDASEIFTETEFTPDAREARRVVLEALEEALLGGIATGREVSDDRARELLYGGPYPAREALELGLVDRLTYLDEVYARIEEDAGEEPAYLSPSDYLSGGGATARGGPRVALV
jgi:protease-4